MILFGYEISTLTLIHCSLTCLLIIFILLREYFWYVSYKQQNQSINQLLEEKDNLLLRIKIEESVQYECSNEINLYNETINLQFNQSEINSNNNSIIINNHNIYLRDQIYFDMTGIVQIVVCCALICIEFYYIHKPHLDLASTESSTEISIKRKLSDFLLKKYPLTNIFIHTSIALLSSMAWYGFMNRDEFVHISLKMYLSLLLSGPICFIIHNFIRIKNYFPQDLDTWKKSLIDIRWYIWLFTRLIGAYDILTTTNTILWLLSVIMILLPIRYTFYYRHQSCSIIETNHIFFLNAIGNSSILFICCYTLYIMSIIKEPIKDTTIPPLLNPSLSIYQGMGLDTNKYSYFGKILQYLDHANSIALFCLFAILNTIILFIRITWFSYISTTGCTWYAWSMIWLFLYIHIGIIIYTLPSVNVLMQKYQTIETYKEGFILQFQKIKTNKDSNSNNSDVDKNTINDIDNNSNKDNSNNSELPQQIFNKILTDSILYYLFVSTSANTNSNTNTTDSLNNNKEGKDNNNDNDSKLNTIFLAMLQTAAYSFKNNKEEEDDDDDVTK